MALPLHGRRLFRSHDLDHVREEMSRVLCPHDVVALGRDARIDAEMNSLAATTWCSTTCTTAPPSPRNRAAPRTSSLQVTLTGFADVRCGCETLASTPDVMLVSRHNEPLQMRLIDNARLLLTKPS